MLAALAAYPELGCTGGPYAVWRHWGVADDVLCAGNDQVLKFLEDVYLSLIHIYIELIDSFRAANSKVRIMIARLTPIADRHPRFLSGTRDWHGERCV